MIDLFIQSNIPGHYSRWVAPFGHPRILGHNASSRLFPVYWVLHRLLAPRYPPCALSSLTSFSGSESGFTKSPTRHRLKAFFDEIQTIRYFSICSFQGTESRFAALDQPPRPNFQTMFNSFAEYLYYQIRFAFATLVNELWFRL